MITDGRCGPTAEAIDRLAWRVGAAARAGVDLVQVRERNLDARWVTRLVRASVDAIRQTRTRILVNDRLDVALAAGADGVHLRGDSVSAMRVRRVGPRGLLIGRSIHALDEAIAATAEGAVDYLMFGTVFSTASKAGVAPAGPQNLASIVQATALPVLAVGGVTIETAPAVARTGAAGVAAIGLFAGAREEEQFRQVIAGMRAAFDTSGHGS